MTSWIIPLTPEPQSFGVTLAGRELRLTVRWFSSTCGIAAEAGEDGSESGWLMDIAEPDNAAPLVGGIPLVGGCDLLAPYGHLELGGSLTLSGDTPPTLDDLGTGVDLYFVAEDE